MLFETHVRFHILVQSSNRVAAYWGIALTQITMFCWYKDPSVILVFPTPRFMEWEFLTVPFRDHCLLVPFQCSVTLYRSQFNLSYSSHDRYKVQYISDPLSGKYNSACSPFCIHI